MYELNINASLPRPWRGVNGELRRKALRLRFLQGKICKLAASTHPVGHSLLSVTVPARLWKPIASSLATLVFMFLLLRVVSRASGAAR